MTRAPLSTAQRIARASASTGIARDFVTTFAIRSCGRRGQPGDPHAVVEAGPDQPRDERPVPERVGAGLAADEALRVEDLPREVGVGGVDARVDDRDGDRLELRQGDPRRVEAAVGEVPLLRGERVSRGERQLARYERLDVANPGDPAERDTGGEVDDERRNRLQALRACSRTALDRHRNGALARAVRQPDGDPGRVRGPAATRATRRRLRGLREPPHPDTCTTAEVPAAKPAAADTRAR